jgi:bis(5'-nucleosyl)-tetraphosphatase (symmetrical)
LNRLLKKIDFNTDRDTVWFVGDLVNRGPSSRKVLRSVMALGESAVTVLGNHDLHLLATVAGVRKPGPTDTFLDVLDADDAGDLIDWLRYRPLLHLDESRRIALVHAGIYPGWRPRQAKEYAAEVETELRSDSWRAALADMYGSTPDRWQTKLEPADRRRFAINSLTRMRFCYSDGRLDFAESGPPGSQRKGLVPWFDIPGRRGRKWNIVFGHWSALGLLRRKGLTAIDTGCVWGRRLTAAVLEPESAPVAVACAEKR